MAVFTAIAGAIGSAAATIGAVTSAVGTAAGVVGSIQQASGQRKAQAAQRRAEGLRQKQMELESTRRQRETIRQQQIARANALATTTAQGAAAEGSSALGGAEGGIFGQAGRDIQATRSNEAIGAGIFDANAQASVGLAQAARGGTLANIGSGLTSLGNSFSNSVERINRIGGR